MKLTVKKGNGDKIHLHIDSEYFMTVDEAYFVSLGLKDGYDIDESCLAELREKISCRRVYNQAVSILSRRDHSCKELEEKLKSRGMGEYSRYAVSRLVEQGYLDDERFAASYSRELIRLKGYGRRRVEQELYRKGIDRDIICAVLDECEFPSERLTELIERKYSKYLDNEKGVNKTVNALLRLGYSYGEIKDSLKEIADREVEGADE